MLVLPSFDEGFGMPALEAMTGGRAGRSPPTAGALPEVVGDAGMLVEPDDAAGFAAAMRAAADRSRTRGGAAPSAGRGAGATVRLDGERARRCSTAYRDALARRDGALTVTRR